MRDAYLMRIISGIEQVVSRKNYHLVLCHHSGEVGVERRYLHDLWEADKVDGFLLYAADVLCPHQTMLEFSQAGVPMVFVDRYFKEIKAPYVVSDNVNGGHIATKHLIDLGHQRIGFVTRPNSYVSAVADRLQGYKRALLEAGLEVETCLVFQGLLPYWTDAEAPRISSYDQAAIRTFLMDRKRPSAIIACNDLIAVQIIEVCRKLNLRIPQDIAIVSFDDDPAASLVTPSLTTVRQYARKMGARAATLLLDMLGGKPVEQQVIVPVELVVRQSCGANLSDVGIKPERG
jgi:LacI family transcriptional regulator